MFTCFQQWLFGSTFHSLAAILRTLYKHFIHFINMVVIYIIENRFWMALLVNVTVSIEFTELC